MRGALGMEVGDERRGRRAVAVGDQEQPVVPFAGGLGDGEVRARQLADVDLHGSRRRLLGRRARRSDEERKDHPLQHGDNYGPSRPANAIPFWLQMAAGVRLHWSPPKP